MTDLRLLNATPDHLGLLQSGLAALSQDLNDPHRISDDALGAALFGPHAACHGVLALDAGDTLIGVALFSPVVSTATGATGAYVSDLWVSDHTRGNGLGQALLRHIAHRAYALWHARFLRLVSYASSARARNFYARLGFLEKNNELVLQLSDDAFEQFKG